MRCWYTRWQMSNALDRGELTARMSRGHAAGCASCQAFGHGLESLHARLSRGAHAATSPVPVERRPRVPLFIAAPLAVGAVTAAIVVVIGMAGQPAGGPIAGPPSSMELPTAGALVDLRGVADRVSQALTNTPLEAELENLIADGRRGLDAILATGGLSRRQQSN